MTQAIMPLNYKMRHRLRSTSLLTWCKRALSIYPSLPPLVGGIINRNTAIQLHFATKRLIADIADLERELRKIGIFPSHNRRY